MEVKRKDIRSVRHCDCTGCSACMNICCRDAIIMKQDAEGFIYPWIDREKCIHCGLCEKNCPVLHPFGKRENYTPQVWAGWSKDVDTRYKSTSGGIFSELARLFLKTADGAVCGARYNNNHMVVHCLIDREEDIPLLRQSKYIQSDINYIYREIKAKLDLGKRVLFCGCPCQVVALRTYLGRPHDNLFLLDFICRGSNSPKALAAFLVMLETKYSSPTNRIWFKNKTSGWNLFSTRIEFENGDIYLKNRYEDPFIQGYIRYNLYMRPSCYRCKFKERNSIAADITLGDFWGIGQRDPALDNDMGTSMMIVNTSKGEALLEAVRPNIMCRKIDMETAIGGNPCLKKSPWKNPRRHRFLSHLDRWGYERCYRHYTRPTLKERLKNAYYTTGHIVKYMALRILSLLGRKINQSTTK
ncbi:MAG: Coenzyme F420 hydrogenase/dehydrogenase, beta subunit C-terminal domain [Victivallaceae bacterium]|nr:Coenzyme F420 hydrogenase/dehydrogenase, beta subunit C-terminal domain [Victivallaceae bacterium]